MEHHEWGWMLVVDLFLGGMGAGCLAVAGTAFVSGRKAYREAARAGFILGPILIGLGTGLLVLDLGRPLQFWRLFAHVNPVSPMSIGSWVILFCTTVSSIGALFHLPPAWLRWVGSRVKPLAAMTDRLALWNRLSTGDGEEDRGPYPDSPPTVNRLRTALAVIGIPLGVGVGIYTGVLLGAIPARPFWNTPMVAQLFLFSALSTAIALIRLSRPVRGTNEVENRGLLRANTVFILLQFFVLIPFLIHGELSTRSARAALDLVLGGPYTMVFWLGCLGVGTLLPLLLEGFELLILRKSARSRILSTLAYVAPVLILFGGYLLRWVFVHAGQDSVFL